MDIVQFRLPAEYLISFSVCDIFFALGSPNDLWRGCDRAGWQEGGLGQAGWTEEETRGEQRIVLSCHTYCIFFFFLPFLEPPPSPVSSSLDWIISGPVVIGLSPLPPLHQGDIKDKLQIEQ